MTLRTILLIEDDPYDIQLTQRAFRKAELINISLQIVQNGDDAVSYLSGSDEYADRDRFPLPVLLLLDLKLPRRNGLEVLEWLRQQPGLKRLPVIVLTSSKESSELNKAYDLGANSYLVKPVGFTALQEMVKTFNLYWLLLSELPQMPTN